MKKYFAFSLAFFILQMIVLLAELSFENLSSSLGSAGLFVNILLPVLSAYFSIRSIKNKETKLSYILLVIAVLSVLFYGSLLWLGASLQYLISAR